MSYKYSFADNEVYSATDVNKITKRLVTSGIADSFSDGVAYNVSKFNDAGRLLYTSGVVPETCLTMKVSKIDDKKVLINPGVAFFDDGSVLEIEDGGEELAYTTGTVNYVYLKNDLEGSNSSYPCCSTEEPEGDFVMLAELNAVGSVIDKRKYARGKLPGYESVGNNAMHLHQRVALTVVDQHRAVGEEIFDIGGNTYEYVVSFSFDAGANNKENLALYRISDGQIISFYRKSDIESIFDNTGLCVYSDNTRNRIYAKPSIVDGNLKLEFEAFWSHEHIDEYGDTYMLDLDLLFI